MLIMSTLQARPAQSSDFAPDAIRLSRQEQEEYSEQEVKPRKRFTATESHNMEFAAFSPPRANHFDAETTGPTFKKQKMDSDNSAEFYVGALSPKKIDPSELAASFALASLASLSPPGADVRDGVDEASFEESRSPRAEPNPVSPEKRSPIRPILKRVHFDAHAKDFYESSTRPRLARSNSYPRPQFFHRRPGAFEPFSAMRYPLIPHPVRQANHPIPFWVHHPLVTSPRRIHPPPILMQPPLMRRPVEMKQWICDYCNVAAFKTFQEACMHEECCKARFMASQSFPPVRKPPLPPRPRGMEAEDHDMVFVSSESAAGSGDRLAKRKDSEDTTGGQASTGHASHASAGHVAVLDPDQQEWFVGSVALAVHPTDSEWLSEINCYVRSHCVEAFSATVEDVAKTSKRGRISLHQVGIRCRFCKDQPLKEKEIAAVSYPTSTAGIYESVKRWQRVHLDACQNVPLHIKNRLTELQSANVWVPTTRQYWADSAKVLGMVDTSDGIRFGKDPLRKIDASTEKTCAPPVDLSKRPPTPPSVKTISKDDDDKDGESMETSVAAASHKTEKPLVKGEFVVLPDDQQMVPPYVYFLMRQVETCHFTEADRFVARSKGPVGFAGFQCRYCNGHAGLGKYFPISAKSLSTNSTSQNIHAHLLKCRKCPVAVKDELLTLKTAKSKSPRLEPGWRKVFFDMIWDRLHGQ